MARQDSFQGSIPLLVLKILARRGALHGYGLATHIKQVSQDVLNVEEGSLYPALHRMEEAELIKARWTTTQNNRRARVYEITKDAPSMILRVPIICKDYASSMARATRWAERVAASMPQFMLSQ
jgi:PadR family transcriptional regulator, regulatory protein PadR